MALVAVRYVFKKGSVCAVDLVCQEILIDDGGVEREPTAQEIYDHMSGYMLTVLPKTRVN